MKLTIKEDAFGDIQDWRDEIFIIRQHLEKQLKFKFNKEIGMLTKRYRCKNGDAFLVLLGQVRNPEPDFDKFYEVNVMFKHKNDEYFDGILNRSGIDYICTLEDADRLDSYFKNI